MRVLTHFTSHFPPMLLDCLNSTATGPDNQGSPLLFKKYIYPTITHSDHKATMDNYRAYVEAHTQKIKDFNRSILSYNKKVDAHLIESPPNKGKKTLLGLFHKTWGSSNDVEYNAAVRSFNELHGQYLRLRKLLPIRANYILVFEAMLHAYTVHLQEMTSIWRKAGRNTLKPLPKAPINPHQIVNQKRNGLRNLNMCKRSIRSHKRRMELAGILVERDFHGSNICVDYFFNPSIIVISEGYNPKLEITKNQSISAKKRKELQHSQSVFTGTSENKMKIIGNVDKSHSDKANVASRLEDNIVFYLNTDGQGPKKSKLGAAKNVKVSPELENQIEKIKTSGEILTEMKLVNGPDVVHKKSNAQIEVEKLESRSDLARKIANGEYNYYAPFPIKELNKEVNSSRISDEDFRELVLQEFIKCAAAINKKNQAGVGSWNLAISYIDKDFGCRNFKGTPLSKVDVISRLVSFKYRLRRVLERFAKRPEWNPRYANVYFNPILKDSSQVGWRFTERWWTKEQARRQKIADDKKRLNQKLLTEKENLKQRSNNDQKLNRRIWAYLRKEIDLVQLEEYVSKLPQEQIEKFPFQLEKLTIKSLTKL